MPYLQAVSEVVSCHAELGDDERVEDRAWDNGRAEILTSNVKYDIVGQSNIREEK